MRIVAEGVEDQDDWEFVAQCGVDEVQGFYVAKPMPEEEFFEWVHRTTAARYNAEQQVADAASADSGSETAAELLAEQFSEPGDAKAPAEKAPSDGTWDKTKTASG